MELKKYFENTEGFGVLSTTDENGKVNAAVYTKPHVIDDSKVAFIMGDKLTHANTQKNPKAVFLFREEGSGYEGKRLYLKKESETDDAELIKKTCVNEYPKAFCEPHYLDNAYLVTFSVDMVLPLVGAK
jgi:hypothetical protein